MAESKGTSREKNGSMLTRRRPLRTFELPLADAVISSRLATRGMTCS